MGTSGKIQAIISEKFPKIILILKVKPLKNFLKNVVHLLKLHRLKKKKKKTFGGFAGENHKIIIREILWKNSWQKKTIFLEEFLQTPGRFSIGIPKRTAQKNPHRG